MSYILVIWTIIAVGQHGAYGPRPYDGWRTVGEFSSQTTCETAGVALNANYRCLKK